MPVQETSNTASNSLKADTIDGIVYAVFAERREFEDARGNVWQVATRRECATRGRFATP